MCHAWMLVHWSGHNHCINLEYPVHIEVWRLTSGCLCICNGLITVFTTDMIPHSHLGLISGCLCIGNGLITVLSTYKPHSHLGLHCALMAQCKIYGLITAIMSANTIQAKYLMAQNLNIFGIQIYYPISPYRPTTGPQSNDWLQG